MYILSETTTLKSFEVNLQCANHRGGYFLIRGREVTYSELVDKFESLMRPGVNEGLAHRVFNRLVNLQGTDARIGAITRSLHADLDEATSKIPLATHSVLAAILPVLSKSDPITAALFVRHNEEAKAVAMKLPGDEEGNSLFAILEGICDWEAAMGKKFDTRFTLQQHENDYNTIWRIQQWEEQTDLTFDNRFSIDRHMYKYHLIFERRLADWTESPAAAQAIMKAYKSNKNEVLDLRGYPIATLPDVVGAIPKLRNLFVDEKVVLPRFPREVELNLIEANPSLFQNFRQSLKEDETFILQALKRNGAMLPLLPYEMRCDMPFLLKTVEQAPGIIAHIPNEVKIDKDFMLSLIEKVVFGQEAWEKHFGAVGEVPPLPVDIVDILSEGDPYNPGKKVADTHMLFLVPATVNGNPFTLKSLKGLVQGGFRYVLDAVGNEVGSKAPAKSKWILMTKELIPGSRREPYLIQKGLIKPGYTVPDLLSVTVGILTQFVKRGERLFSDNPWTFTRCSETVNEGQVTAGGFTETGLFLDTGLTGISLGLAAMRNLTQGVS